MPEEELFKVVRKAAAPKVDAPKTTHDFDESDDEDLFKVVGKAAPEQKAEKKYSYGDAFGTAALQGMFFGLPDEAMAMLSTLINDPEDPAMSGSFKERYYRNWKMAQDELQQQREEQPGAMIAGDMLGAGASMLIPGLGVGGNILRAGKVAREGAAAARAVGSTVPTMKALMALGKEGASAGMKSGALQGLGVGQFSWSDPESNEIGMFGKPLLRAVQGGLDGYLTGGLFGGAIAPGVSKLTTPVINAAKTKIAQPILQALAPFMKVAPQDAKEVLKNPALYAGEAKSVNELAKEGVGKVNAFSKDISKRDNLALSHLTDDSLMSPVEMEYGMKNSMLNTGALFRDKKGNLKSSYGPAFVNEMKAWDAKIYAKAGEKNYLTQKEVKELLDQMEPYAKFDKMAPKEFASKQNGYKMAFGKFNEQLSKSNDEYNKIMEGVRSDTEMIDGIAKGLGMKKSITRAGKEAGRYEGTDSVEGALRSIGADKKGFTREKLIEAADKLGNTDLGAMAKRVRLEKAFETKRPGVMTGGAMTISPWAAAVAAARDMGGPPGWRKAAVMSDPNRRGGMENLFRRPVSMFSTEPATDPYYIGLPLVGQSAEEYKRNQDKP